MFSEANNPSKLSKKAAKKVATKQKKTSRHLEKAATALVEEPTMEVDPLSGHYGHMDFKHVRSKVSGGMRAWTDVEALTEEMKGQEVLVRGHAQATRLTSKNRVFVVVREERSSVQCVVSVEEGKVSQQMVKFVNTLCKESVVIVNGIVSVPDAPVKATSQQVELQVRRIYCINRAAPILPFNMEDASRSEAEIIEIEKTLKANDKKPARVKQDTRLNNRALDLRTPANHAIFNVEYAVEKKFRQFLDEEGFIGIRSPKLISGSSEGGAAVFTLNYMGQPACLAQSPQLYKQMTICGGRKRVFEIGPVFRAERSFTHRHLCEFTGLDVEMQIHEHYSEVMDIVDRLFVAIFDHLNGTCKKDLEDINKQYPFEPLKYLRTTPRLTFKEGVEMLKEAGVEVDPVGDLSTETERKLGQLVLEKYNTEFYILHQYPLAVRPFYTMPCDDNDLYSNSFDVFIRGEEIISGAQRINDPDFLCQRAEACGIDLKTISTYIDSFRNGTPPHGGFGAGLERVVMLFCCLDNIRKASLFPRDPNRITP